MSTRDKVSAAELEQPGGFAWCVFDQQVYDANKAIAKYDKSGLVKKGANAAELAAAIEVDPAALQDTVNVYNAVSASGATDEFGRTEGCIAFADGAMYAIKVAPGIHHEMGGIRINAKNQALDASGAPIPGLYAAGEVTGGIHGDNRIGGNAVCDIEVFGKNVGEAGWRRAPGVADAVRCGGRGGGLSAPRRARFAFLVFGPCRRFGARWGSARLGEDLLFHHEVVLYLADELLQGVDAVGANVGADEHVHDGVAPRKAPLR